MPVTSDRPRKRGIHGTSIGGGLPRRECLPILRCRDVSLEMLWSRQFVPLCSVRKGTGSMLWSEVNLLLVGFVLCAVYLLHGFAEAAEAALLASNRLSLKEMADQGDRKAGRALRLLENPLKVLATIVTVRKLLSTIAAVYLGSILITEVEDMVVSIKGEGWRPAGHSAAVFLVSSAVTVIALILGTLVPKRLAVHHPEFYARFFSFPVELAEKLFWPIARAMGWITDLIAGRLGARGVRRQVTSLHQIRYLIDMGESDGTIDSVQGTLAHEALGLGDLQVREIMRPRGGVQALEIGLAGEDLWRDLREIGHSRVPVYRDNLDQVVGVLDPKELLGVDPQISLASLQPLLRPALFVPDTTRVDQLLVQFRQAHETLAVVIDEFGATRGVVTLGSILDALVGDLLEENRLRHQQAVVPRGVGEWLVDGAVPLAELFPRLQHPSLVLRVHPQVKTLGGLLMHELGHPPDIGERVSWLGWEFEVLDLDGRRIDRVLVRSPRGSGPAVTA